MSDPIKNLDQAIREQASHEEQGLKDQIRTLIEKYQTRDTQRDAAIRSFQDEGGDLKEDEFTWSEYDEVLDDSAHEARGDLGGLLRQLSELVGA
ncbi:hypothetical protein ACIPX0_26555 [Streptomyces sp. NPDC090075]|uniref:hypothetical protein n=1 Tax=Streptomyces sp. NPDC090075 TaxID=3365937 RepID=UPI003822F398